jgi:hypothetical protein
MSLNYMNLDKIIVTQIICYLLFLIFILLMIVSVKDKNITQYILEFYKEMTPKQIKYYCSCYFSNW